MTISLRLITNSHIFADYIHERLTKYNGTIELSKWIDENTKSLKEIPR